MTRPSRLPRQGVQARRKAVAAHPHVEGTVQQSQMLAHQREHRRRCRVACRLPAPDGSSKAARPACSMQQRKLVTRARVLKRVDSLMSARLRMRRICCRLVAPSLLQALQVHHMAHVSAIGRPAAARRLRRGPTYTANCQGCTFPVLPAQRLTLRLRQTLRTALSEQAALRCLRFLWLRLARW